MKFLHIVFVAVFLFACNESSKTTNQHSSLSKTFDSDSLGFSIQLPTNWHALENPSQRNIVGIFENLKDSSDQFKENIQIWREDIPIPIADSLYQQAAITQLNIANPDLIIRKGKDLYSDSLKFKGFEFDFNTNDSAAYSVIGYTLLHGDYGYNFNLTAEKAKKDAYKSLFDSIIKTFKPKP